MFGWSSVWQGERRGATLGLRTLKRANSPLYGWCEGRKRKQEEMILQRLKRAPVNAAVEKIKIQVA
jgi:hypothetical protein